MIGAMIIPTGIGAEIGGHAGDANPAAKLIAECCDTLIVHPNVVNASDINEMPANCLYVEGSTLDRFFSGECRLAPVSRNRILLVVNAPVETETINSVSAARATIGATIEILELKTPLRVIAIKSDNGCATGRLEGVDALLRQVRPVMIDHDALAIQTVVEVEKDVALDYLANGGVNPWGGAEALLSSAIASSLQEYPVAHAPLESEVLKGFKAVVDPRLSAEVVSVSYLHCVLKGLHRAPRPTIRGAGLSVDDVGVLVGPWGCVSPPHHDCYARRIPMIAVRENRTVLKQRPLAGTIIVDNYLEAAGQIMALRAGVDPETVRRPMVMTSVSRVK